MSIGKYICVCGRTCRTDGECCMCRMKKEQKKKIVVSCRVCAREFEIVRRYLFDYARRGSSPACAECKKKENTDRILQAGELLTPEQRIDCRRRALDSIRAKASDSVRKQWETMRADPVKWDALLKKRKTSMTRVWSSMAEEEKNRRVSAFFSSHNRGRSAGNDRLKQAMQEAGLYDGFKSEQIFHGYVPDEINHDLKIIVEFFGDAYHCNPRMYKDKNQYINLIKRTVGEQWERDRRRLGCFYKYGYSVIIVWARDFNNKTKSEIERIGNEIAEKRRHIEIV